MEVNSNVIAEEVSNHQNGMRYIYRERREWPFFLTGCQVIVNPPLGSSLTDHTESNLQINLIPWDSRRDILNKIKLMPHREKSQPNFGTHEVG